MIQCCNPKQESFEFPIKDKNVKSPIYIQDYFPKIKDVCALKCKIIEDYKHILAQLECGIQPDLEFILEEISLVYIYEE